MVLDFGIWSSNLKHNCSKTKGLRPKTIALKSKLVNQTVQIRSTNPQLLRRRDLVSAFCLQRTLDHPSLHGLNCTFQRGFILRARSWQDFQHLLRNELEPQRISITQHDQALQQILKLTDVAWPVVFLQNIDELRCQFRHRMSISIRRLGGEVCGEDWDVVYAISQRW